MDAGFVDEKGFVYIMSRSDDVINVAGHRLSAGALEEVIQGLWGGGMQGGKPVWDK